MDLIECPKCGGSSPVEDNRLGACPWCKIEILRTQLAAAQEEIQGLKNSLESECDQRDFLHKLLQARHGDGWNILTIYDARKVKEREAAAQLWREKVEGLLIRDRDCLNRAIRRQRYNHDPEVLTRELEAEVKAITTFLTPPTPTPGSEGGGGDCICKSSCQVDTRCSVHGIKAEAGEFVTVRREDLKVVVNLIEVWRKSKMVNSKELNKHHDRLKAALKASE